MDQGTSVKSNQCLKEGQNPCLRGVCEGRENRRVTPIREVPDSARGLTRIHDPSGVNEKGYEGWLKAKAGRRWTVEEKLTPERSKNRHSYLGTWMGG